MASWYSKWLWKIWRRSKNRARLRSVSSSFDQRFFSPLLEPLEERRLLATFMVTSLDDAAGTVISDGFAGTAADPYRATTLRAAISSANADGTPDTIVFAPSLTASGGATILTSQTGDGAAGPSAFAITTNITIQGPVANNGITLDGNNVRRLFYVSPTGSLTLNALTLTGGRAKGGTGGGGGAGLGGAIFNRGTLNLIQSTLSGNTAEGGNGGNNNNYGGGGMSGVAATGGGGAGGPNGGFFPGIPGGFGGGGGFNAPSTANFGGAGGFGGGGGSAANGAGGNGGFGGGGGQGSGGNGNGGFGGASSFGAVGGGGGGGMGGAVFNAAGTVNVTNSTLSQNSAIGGAGATVSKLNGSGFGGAIFNLNGALNLRNSTLAANTVSGGPAGPVSGAAEGGAVYTLGLNNVWESGTQTGPTIGSASGAVVTTSNSIFANTVGGSDIVNNNSAFSGGSNLATQSTSLPTGVSSTTTAALNLDTLKSNGGPTQTVALLPSSSAINSGDNVGLSLTTDQRGFRRTSGAFVDVGAFEAQPATVFVNYTAATDVLTVFGLLSSADGINVTTTADNVVQVALASAYSTIVVTGDVGGGFFALDGTNRTLTINTGAAQAPISTFNVALAGGDDTLNFSLAAASTGVGNVVIDMGTGSNDNVTIGNTNINGDFVSYGGAVLVNFNSTIATRGGAINVTGRGSSSQKVGLTIQSGATLNASGGNVTLSGTGNGGLYNSLGVYLTGANVQTIGAGGVTITGTGGNILGSSNMGVRVRGSSISAANGAIRITGVGSGSGSNLIGVDITNGSTVAATASGNITLNGTGGANGSYRNYGVAVRDPGTKVSAASGLVTITGIAGGANPQPGINSINSGVTINSQAEVSIGSGGVNISGTGAGLTTSEHGVSITGAATVASTTSGAISISGIAAATGTYKNYGVWLSGAGTRVGSPSGSVTITGTGGGSSTVVGLRSVNVGVFITSEAQVSGGAGGVNITGHGSGTSSFEHGVVIQGKATVSSTLTGALTITGAGSANGTYGNYGVFIGDAGTDVRATSGTVTITGTGGGTQFSNHGILITGDLEVVSSSGIVALNGTASQDPSVGASDGVRVMNSAKVQSVGNRVEISGRAVSATSSAVGSIGVYFDAAELDAGDGVTLNGTGGGNASSGAAPSVGVYVRNTSVGARGTGNVVLNGTGSGGAISTGVLLRGLSTNVTAINGNILINGLATSTGTGNDNVGVDIDGAARVFSLNGNASVTGTSGDGHSNNVGVLIRDAGTRVAALAAVTIDGTGRGSGFGNNGVQIDNGVTVDSSGGAATPISIRGIGSSGVRISGSTATLASIGSIDIRGTSAATTGGDRDGVLIDGAKITSTSAVTIHGISDTGISGNLMGIRVINGATEIVGGTQGVTLTGISRSSGTAAVGTRITGGLITSTTGGSVTINGTSSATATNDAVGVLIDGTSARVTTNGGLISIAGIGGGTGDNGWGVGMLLGAQLSAGGTGAVSIVGTGGNGISNNSGVVLRGTGTLVLTDAGGVNITGIGAGTGMQNYGVDIRSGALVSATLNGGLTITGTGVTSSGTDNNGVYVGSATINAVLESLNAPIIKGTASGSNAGVIIDSSATLNLTLGFAPAAGAQISVVQVTGTGISGTFSNLADNSSTTLAYNSENYLLFTDYTGGPSNKDLVLNTSDQVDLSVTGSPIAENGGVATVTATIANPSTQSVTVVLSFSGSAAFGSDYSASSTSITIPAGARTASINLTAINDTTFEGDETITVDVASVTGGTENGTQSVGVTVTDDDPQPSVTLSLAGSPLAENGGVATVTARLSNPSTQTVTINLSFTGSATNLSDYSRSATSITISAGQTSGSITLTGINDGTFEGDESVVVDIASVTNGSENGTQTVSATIADDESSPTVSLSLAGSPLAENGGTATVIATLNNPSIQDVTINFALSGAALSNTDYSASTTSIVIAAGQTSGSITLSSINDSTFEGDESFVVDITTVTNGTESGTQQVTATIADDDPLPNVTLQVSPTAFAENGGTATIVARLSNPSVQAITIDLGFTGAATNNFDYSRSGSQIVITAGQTSGSITLTGIDDITSEGSESVVIDITGVTNGTENGSQQVTATINDDEGLPSVTLSLAGSPLAENGGVATVTATLSNPSTQDVTVTLGFTGAALSGTDYSASLTTIVISAGQTSGSITLAGINDITFEGNESVVVDITGVTNGTENGSQQVTATINDDDNAPSVTLSQAGSPLAENGGVATVVATLSNPSTQDVTVTLGFTGTALSGTDYSASSTSIVIAAGQTSGSITLAGLDDITFEGNESVVVDITGVTNGTESGTQQVTATISDDENAPSVTLSLTGSSLAENGGVATVTATLSNPSTQDVTVTLGVIGTALSSTDYSASSTSIVIAAGQTSGSITLMGLDDITFEGSESIVVDITGVTNGTESGTQQVTATISDDESAPSVTLSLTGSPLAENGGVATVTATLSNPSTQDVTITLGFNGAGLSGTDYSASSTSITIAAGNTSGSITLTGVDDITFEGDESVVIDITDVTNGTENGTQHITATINDDDSAPSVTLSLAGSPLAENGGVATVTATLSNPSSQDVTIDFGFTGPATRNADYSASGNSIVISAGQTSGSITLNSLNDALSETAENILVDITSVTGGTENGTQQVTATIVDDDRYVPAVTTLTINGTPGVDELTFRLDVGSLATVFAGETRLNPGITSVNLANFGPEDIIKIVGRNGVAESATLSGNLLSFSGGGFTITGNGPGAFYLFGQAEDAITLVDTAGNDALYALPSHVIMQPSAGAGFINQAIGFGTVVAQAINGGVDMVLFYDGAGNDTYTSSPSQAALVGVGYSITAENFEQNYAFATAGGNDTATFNDSPADDIFSALPSYAIMDGGGEFSEAIGFDSVVAIASSGNDTANFYDSVGDDTYISSPTQATFNGVGFAHTAQGFDANYAISTNGGNDTATLNDSAGDDTFYAQLAYSALLAGNSLSEPVNFNQVTVIGSGGSDLAYLYDSAGNDTLVASGNQAQLSWGLGHSAIMQAFDTVYAVSSQGGADEETQSTPPTFLLQLYGDWT